MLSVVLKNVSKIYKQNEGLSSEPKPINSDGGRYRRIAAVDNISLTISEGQRIGIIGKNGAGKSTLLHIIAGLSAPTSGEVQVSGKVTSIMTLGVGLRDDLSGRENIYIDGEIQGKSRAEVDLIIDQVIEFSELGEFIDYPVKTYSTGMKARLGFSMISCLDPEILIIDEALSVGDATFSVKATARIREICAKGKIVIVVSHSMGSIRDICDRCLWIDNGCIVMDGEPVAVTNAYIESVRSRNEASSIADFTRFIDQPQSTPGAEISELIFITDERNASDLQVEAGKNLVIKIAAKRTMDRGKTRLNVKIIRLDEQIMFDQNFEVEDFSDGFGNVGLEIVFEPLILGSSIYRVDATMIEGDFAEQDVCASRSALLDVFVGQPPRGGKPMLLFPLSLEFLPEPQQQ